MEPIFPIGSLVRYEGEFWRVVACDGLERGAISAWLRVDGGNHYTTATTRELELIE